MSEAVQKYAYIDLMRAVAILMVLMVHVGQFTGIHSQMLIYFFAFGQMGVQLFFVASGLTLCLSMQKRVSEPHAFRRFYLRRFFRIAPLYYTGVVIYLIFFSINYGHFLPSQMHITDILVNVLFVHGLCPSSMNAIVPGGWSIGCEMLFYLIFPLLFKMITSINKAFLFASITLLFDFAFNIVWAHLTNSSVLVESNCHKYFFIANQLPVFAWGFILYQLLQSNFLDLQKLGIKLFLIIWFFLSLLILLYAWKYDPIGPLSHCLVPAIGGVLFTSTGLIFKLFRHIPSFLLKIGRKSYSIYILHFMIVWTICPGLMRTDFFNEIAEPLRFLTGYSLTFIICYFLSAQTERFIERKGISLGETILERHPIFNRGNYLPSINILK